MFETGGGNSLAGSAAGLTKKGARKKGPARYLRNPFHTLGIFRLRNQNLVRDARQCALYDKLLQQYREIIEAPIEAKEQRNCHKIWVCWLQGFDSAPDIVRACLNSLRQNLPGYEIVTLDETNLHDYVQLPDFVEDKYRRGIIPRAHYTDLVRLELLCAYGGLWIDATVLCTSPALMPVIEAAPLFLYREYRISPKDVTPIVASNWFIGSVSNHPILLLTKKLLYAYWQRESRLKNYFIFHLFLSIAARRYPEEWAATPPFNNIDPHMLQFNALMPYTPELWEQILRFSPFHKLSYRSNTSDDEGTMFMHAIREYLPG